LAKKIVIEEKEKNEGRLQRSTNPKDKMFFLVKIDICDMALRMLQGHEKSLSKEDVPDLEHCEIVDMAIFYKKFYLGIGLILLNNYSALST